MNIDLAMLDTTDKAENGVEMPLLHPVTNEETGVILVLRGSDSRRVKTAMGKFRKIQDDEKKSDADKEKASADFLTECIMDIKNAFFNGNPVVADKDGIKWFVTKFSWAAIQVLRFINEIEHFLPEGDSN